MGAVRALLSVAILLGLSAAVLAAGGPARTSVLGIAAAPAQRTVVAGETVRFRVQLSRRHGWHRRVAIHVHGVPRDSRIAWRRPMGPRFPRAYRRGRTVVMSAGQRHAVLAIHTARRTPEGQYRLYVHAYGKRARTTRMLTLRVVEPEALGFTVTGTATEPVAPGTSSPIALQVTNPHDFPIQVQRIDGAAVATDREGCDAFENYAVDPVVGPLPLAPGTSTVDGARLRMMDLDRPQDACKGATVQLNFGGEATR